MGVDKYKLDFAKKRYAVTKWQYEELDLYIELIHLINCEHIDKCGVCCHFLKWVIRILGNKWDNIKFIELEEALKFIPQLKNIISNSPLLEHFSINRKKLIQMIKIIKRKGEAEEVIMKNKDFFVDGNRKYTQTREVIFKIIVNNEDIDKVDDFKGELFF